MSSSLVLNPQPPGEWHILEERTTNASNSVAGTLDKTSDTISRGSMAEFSHLSYEIKSKKEGTLRLLDNVSVRVRQGEVSGSD